MSKDPEKAMEVVDSDQEDVEDEEDDEVTAGDPHSAAKAALLQNPALLSALQGKLNGMVGASSGYIQVDRRLSSFTLLSFFTMMNAITALTDTSCMRFRPCLPLLH